jgi:hypothetical protein
MSIPSSTDVAAGVRPGNLKPRIYVRVLVGTKVASAEPNHFFFSLDPTATPTAINFRNSMPARLRPEIHADITTAARQKLRGFVVTAKTIFPRTPTLPLVRLVRPLHFH